MLEQSAEKMKILKGVVASVEKQFGKGAIMALGDEDGAEPIATIGTGSLALDLATGVGGYPRGRVIEVYGPESSGKTTLALHAIAQAQQRGTRRIVKGDHIDDQAVAVACLGAHFGHHKTAVALAYALLWVIQQPARYQTINHLCTSVLKTRTAW